MAYPNKVGQEKLSLMMSFPTFQRMTRFREPSTVSRYAADLYRVMIKTGLNPDQLVEYAKGTDETGIGDLKAKVTEGYTSRNPVSHIKRYESTLEIEWSKGLA